ncbi:signal transduction histidine kinase, nitrogen specific, NtrB [Rhodopseudomonas palustris HaA2]|uniref:histidine kinase n=1 Tax=Rhodopseudomonas palustris (strain HaA2) TaxID=316058 RepID=Q2J047_RHOP2|nr:PAS domain-containing sensor histidine kinase [Rhodopseudomonas palustris]ABD06163.1 signal transduction histidine kinase, nitrogen specific, NtrB [Rhodopseudomonas palustris HaA2]
MELIGFCYAQSRWWRIGLALCIVLAGIAIRVALHDSLGDGLTFVTLYPAVAAAAMLGGAAAGVTATIVATASTQLMVASLGRADNLLGLVVFLCGCIVIVAMAQAMRVFHARLIEAAEIGESERQLRRFVEGVPAAIAMFDCNMRYLAASTRWLSAFHPTESVIGRLHYDVFPNIREEWREAHRRGLAGEVVRNNEDCHDRADGVKRWVRWEVAPWRDSRGEIGGITIYFEDITENRAMTERLAQAQQLETVGRLSGAIAHDFNNLLTVIVGNAELLREQLEPHEDLRQLAEHISSAGDRAAELTQRLLAFGRRQILAPVAVDLNWLVQSVAQIGAASARRGVKIRTVLEPARPLVRADRLQLESAILNILINAQEAVADDSGRIAIVTGLVVFGDRQDQVRPGRYGVVEITDNGVGMSERVRGQAFEPFFTTKEFGTASGLGLSMVYGFVKQSDGHVTIDSQPGVGTTIRLFLPLANPTPSDGDAAPSGA